MPSSVSGAGCSNRVAGHSAVSLSLRFDPYLLLGRRPYLLFLSQGSNLRLHECRGHGFCPRRACVALHPKRSSSFLMQPNLTGLGSGGRYLCRPFFWSLFLHSTQPAPNHNSRLPNFHIGVCALCLCRVSENKNATPKCHLPVPNTVEVSCTPPSPVSCEHKNTKLIRSERLVFARRV